jgi:C4-dicarboxylate-specific signal transduction histidine kinase
MMDITERKASEERIREVQAELAHASRLTTMGELLVSIAHEVNQPLTAIVANANAGAGSLDGNAVDQQELREIFRDIASAGIYAAEILKRLRNLTKKSEAELTELDLKPVIEEVLTLVRAELQKHEISVELHLDPIGRSVYGDKIQLQQVFVNLIVNAVDAMGSVADSQRVLSIATKANGADLVLVTVEDTGAGISLQARDRMFETFHTTKPQGIGMGLAVCRTIMEAHGGDIWALPREPYGTTLCFTVRTARSN